MISRWRPRPAWLKKVYTNPDPRPAARSVAPLKVYWGHQSALSWPAFLDMVAYSEGEPVLLYMSDAERAALDRQRFAAELQALLGQTSEHSYDVSASINWKALMPPSADKGDMLLHLIREELLQVRALKWDELMGMLEL